MPIEPSPCRWELPRPGRGFGDFVGQGADLEPGTVLEAYRQGLFPMPVEGELGWWSPVRRGVLPLHALRVSRSLRHSAKHFEIRVDTAFDEVIAGCADPARDAGWIDEAVIGAYTELHRLGWVHSVEAWCDGQLAGGLYGVAIGGLFAGESMFTRVRDASKVALMGLVELLSDEHAAARVLDAQWQTPHLASLGVMEIARPEYLRRLDAALDLPLPMVFRNTGTTGRSHPGG